MRTIKTLKEFLKAERQKVRWFTLVLDCDQWGNEEWYSMDPCTACKVGCVFCDYFIGKGSKGFCLNCGQELYWHDGNQQWQRRPRKTV
jgi:hypothetical protein